MCENVSNEVLLAWFKFQAKNSKLFWSMGSGRMTKYTPLSPPLSTDKGLKDIRHSMRIRNLMFGDSCVIVSYLILCDSLLQNATDIITKCDSYFITKCDSSLTKCDVYYKLRQYRHYNLIQHVIYQ